MSLAYLQMRGCFSKRERTTRYFDKQNALYEANKEWLIAEHPLKYVALYEGEIGTVYESRTEAFEDNKEHILAKKCMIRLIEPPLSYFIPDWKEQGYINGDR